MLTAAVTGTKKANIEKVEQHREARKETGKRSLSSDGDDDDDEPRNVPYADR